MTHQRRRRFDLPPSTVDILLAVVVFVASVINVSSQDATGISAIPGTGFVLLGLASVALYWRRRWSVGVLGVALVMTVAWSLLGYDGNPVFHVLASLYAVGRYVAPGTISLAALVVTLIVVALEQAADGDSSSELATALVITALPWYVGRRVRIRRFYADAERERAEHLEWRRATEAQRAIADARAGIARELHDVVAHNVSLMTVQAGLARLVVEDDPQQAREAIGAVEEAGRRALDELRHLLGVLRPESASGELTPQPALHEIDELLNQLRGAGLEVSSVVDISSLLPVRVDLFAYRIVQEALTNVLKHGGAGATAHVRLEETDGHIDIEVTNTGTPSTSLPGSGRGIVGMQERATMLGGSFEAGPRLGGGFRVMARLPIGDQ